MAAQQRKLLERLMGSSDGPAAIDFADPKLCKPYCVDFCVYELFSGTKVGGPKAAECPYVHIERARMLYQSLPAKIPAFEHEFERGVARAAAAVRRRIAAAEQSLQADPPEPTGAELDGEIAQLSAEVAAAGAAGLITADTLAKVQRLEALRAEQKRAAAAAGEDKDTPQQQRLQVCQVCASLLSPAESDQRLADHFSGKVHRAYVRVFDALDVRAHAGQNTV